MRFFAEIVCSEVKKLNCIVRKRCEKLFPKKHAFATYIAAMSMKHKCIYEAVWSISREMETSSQMNLLCTDDNDVCPHLVQGERVDVEVLYRLDGVDEAGCVEESHNCVDDFDNNLEDSISYSCFGYDEYPVQKVLARNCSGRILFWKLVLDLYMEELGRVVHFDGNWILRFPSRHRTDYKCIVSPRSSINSGNFELLLRGVTIL